MQAAPGHARNVVLLQGACLWIVAALVLAWCMVGLGFNVHFLGVVFPGKFTRVRQAHIDLLLMSALILGFYAARIPLPWHVRWAMVVGAFTNSSLFLLMAMIPVLDPGSEAPAQGWSATLFLVYEMSSLALTSYGFGRGAMTILRTTLKMPR
jgi:hypothetical protein